ncbi:AI-2E family transporter [soil metagenome]
MTWSDRMRARVRALQGGQDDQQGVVPSPGQSRRGRVGGAGAPGAPRPPDTSAPPTAAAAHALGLPPALVMTTGWAICVLVIAFLIGQILDLLSFFSEVTVPLAISLLTTALAAPVVDRLQGFGLPRRLAAVIVVVAGLVVFGGILTVVGSQVAGQFDQLRDDVSEGLRQVQMWLRTGPLGLSDEQLNDLIDRGRESLQGADTEVVSQAAAVGTTLGHFLAGLFIVLFATFFFCAEGSRMWRWVVSLLPAAARPELNTSGQVAWVSLTAFVRATVLVALADAIGVAAGAVLLGVPLALALGLLVFVGAFIPIIGAAISGSVAVLVALVAQGPVVALLMLGAVVLVQQLESHVLQPFLMGRFVAVHPLGIILAIAAGLVAGGVVGALIAVPLVACANAVGKHLAGRHTDDDPHPETAGELTTDTAHDPTDPGNASTSAGDDPIDPSGTAGPATQPRSAH